MTTEKRRYHNTAPAKPALIDCLDEKSLNVLRSLGYNIEEMRELNKAKHETPMIIHRILTNIEKIDRKTLQDIKKMCYVGKNLNNSRPIIRPFKNKILELYKYVNNNPDFGPSH
jgi:DNA-binding transcriptional MerR regulator